MPSLLELNSANLIMPVTAVGSGAGDCQSPGGGGGDCDGWHCHGVGGTAEAGPPGRSAGPAASPAGRTASHPGAVLCCAVLHKAVLRRAT